MINVNNANNFKKFAKVLDTILKVIFWIVMVAMPLCVVMILMANFSPKEVIEELFIRGAESASYSIGFGSMSLDVNPMALGVDNVIKSINIIAIPGLIAASIIILTIRQIRGILKNVISETPFSDSSIKCIKNLGYITIIGGTVFTMVISYMEYMWIEIINIKEMLLTSNLVNSFEIDLVPFDGTIIVIGALILLLAKIFEYGKYLQEEYDATL